METWGEFYEAIKFEINKGDQFKDIIPEKTFQALRAIEQNWTYRWMDTNVATLQIDLESENPQVLTLPLGIKEIKSIKLIAPSGGSAKNLVEISPEDFVPDTDGTPAGYFIQSGKFLWLDKNPDEAYKVHLVYSKFTLKAEMDESLSHLILENGASCLLAATMMNISPTAREPSWLETYSPIYQTGLHTLHVWDEESRMADNEVIFGGAGGDAYGRELQNGD